MDTSVAVIGMAGRFPMAKNIPEFYSLLLRGMDAVRPVTVKRRRDTNLPDDDYQLMGCLDDIDKFDHEFFKIPKAEADFMDPNQRLMLEVIYHAIENAGYNVDDLSGTRTSLYIACSEFSYIRYIEAPNPWAPIGNNRSITAGRISRQFNFLGNSILVDTTCSSSLVAVELAFNELVTGRTETAIVCGASLCLFPPVRSEGKGIGISSPTGKAKAFSAKADGTVNGEAVACVVLRTTEKALAKKDNVQAIIKGIAVNQDADRSSFLTAPSKIAQTEVILAAWEAAKIDPASVTFIETHGTGTRIGDPIEIEGLNAAFRSFTDRQNFCAIASVKSNIGHTDAASGVTGLIKTVLSLKHRKLFPSLHFEEPNPLIDFEQSAVFVNTRAKDWIVEAAAPRRAGVSSFGLSGTNCHAVLEEPSDRRMPMSAGREWTGPQYLFTVSAKTADGLRANLTNLRRFLQGNMVDSPENVAYTLNAGRKHYRHRHVVIAGSMAELGEALAQFPTGDQGPRENPGLFLVFPHRHTVTDTVIARYCSRFDTFKEHFAGWQEILSVGRGAGGEKLRTLLFQYCVFRLLENKGLVSENLLGIGIGLITIDLIIGEITLEEAVARAVLQDDPGISMERLARYLDNAVNSSSVIFLELGIDNDLGLLLTKACPAGHEVLGLNMPADPGDCLDIVKKLYLRGFDVDWKRFYETEAGMRTELPGYPFETSRCWAKEPEKDVIDGWLYHIDWQQKDGLVERKAIAGRWLVITDTAGIGEAFCRRLSAAECSAVRVYGGTAFEAISGDRYRIRLDEQEDYVRLLEVLNECGQLPEAVIHLVNCDPHEPVTRRNIDKLLSRGVYSQFQMTKAIAEFDVTGGMEFVLVSTGAIPVTGVESTIHPGKSSSFGFIRGVVAEYPGVRAKCIDLLFSPERSPDFYAERLLNELSLVDRHIVVAYRDTGRYIPGLGRLKLRVPDHNDGLVLRRDGVYIVTGGASGVGYEMCKHLIARERIELVVIGRTPLPSKESWPEFLAGDARSPDETVERVSRLQDLALAGKSNIHYYSCDLGEESVGHLIRSIRARHGVIRGIIHCAALPGKKRISHSTLKEFRSIIAGRVHAVLSLMEATEAEQPDFTVIFSSVSAVLPGIPRKSDYAAACAFADTYIKYVAATRRNIKVIHWCEWQETGMSFRVNPDKDHAASGKKFLHVTNDEGIAVFDRILQTANTDVVVMGNLSMISVEEAAGIKDCPYFIVVEEDTVPPAKIEDSIPQSKIEGHATQDDRIIERDRRNGHSQELGVLREPDATGTQRAVAGIWGEVLKLKSLSLEDDFFDLGGHSLIGFTILNTVEKTFGISLEIEDMFTYPVLRGFAARVDSLLLKLPALN
jgi:3-oxoacyl-(acyl-carrier-protein) synthase/NAD(P)-dependent dehydrogenase (short-subunit alcohol dehydrogenase family)